MTHSQQREDDDPTSPSIVRRKAAAFGLIVAMCLAGAVGYGWYAKTRSLSLAASNEPLAMTPIEKLPQISPGVSDQTSGIPATIAPAPKPDGRLVVAPEHAALPTAAWQGLAAKPMVMFRSTALGDSYGRVSVAYLDAPKGKRQVSPLQCDRMHFAAGRGICLEAQRGLMTTYHAHLFDTSFKVTASFPLAGPPSRARMSPDGKRAATTVFVTGHSYAGTDFTTRTSVIDAASGTMVAEDLESFAVERDGKAIKASDFNIWGVTFTRDSRQFYATLGTGGQTLLVRGDLGAKRLTVLREGVECPSLSPDNLRIAFKHRRERGPSGRITWGLSVLDLASGQVTPLSSESRNVDDQVEWLGNDELLYAMPEDETRASASTNIWALAIDGKSAPRLLLPLAYSPAVVLRP
jgi:hypothetical protein